ncbi:hypothetical protein BpHYR1_044227 [Brachionus plicatilis]|uniref:Uncharacterized protein n=1 Tax=Brachionus plicatilis TaxID=10195 RepID=A0A3M7SW32_BRAPC|nr:hypothetical protein BpHYR1_044227 [Brachionus plicatilis]
MKSLIEMVKIQSSQIENLLNENKTLKSVVETNNLILKQIQTTLSNLPSDFPNLPLISSQSTSDKNITQQVYHSFAHAINSNSSKTNNTPRSQKSVFDLEKIKDKNNWPRGAVINRYHKPFALRQRYTISTSSNAQPSSSATNENTQSSSEANTSNTPNQ